MKVISFIVVLSIAIISHAQNSSNLYCDAILGTYVSPNKRSHIQFVKRDSLYFGKLIWNVNPNIKDDHNLDKRYRNESLIGKDIFTDFNYKPYERSWYGKFYDAESGITYDCILWLENNRKYLMAKGYVRSPIFGRTEILKRIK